MTPILSAFLFLLVVHWFADFCLQTNWQAQNKSKDNEALTHHVLVYTCCLLIASLIILPLRSAIVFMAVNGALHFATDWCTSRWSAEMWRKNDRHNFFVVVGLDQLIHQATLGITLQLCWGR